MRPKAKGSQVYNSQKVRITLDLTVAIDAVVDRTTMRIDSIEAFEIEEAGKVPGRVPA